MGLGALGLPLWSEGSFGLTACFRRRGGGGGGGGGATVRGKRTYGGRPRQRVEEQGTWASQKHSEAGDGRPVDRGVWTAKTVKRPRQQPAHPQYANYWAPLTRKRHTMPHPAQSQHANYWAPRTRRRHQQEHRPQRPTELNDPTQHAKGRTGDCPGPRTGATTRRNVTQGGGGGLRSKGLCTKNGPKIFSPGGVELSKRALGSSEGKKDMGGGDMPCRPAVGLLRGRGVIGCIGQPPADQPTLNIISSPAGDCRCNPQRSTKLDERRHLAQPPAGARTSGAHAGPPPGG